jgi:predicted RNA polymerase sigma factor
MPSLTNDPKAPGRRHRSSTATPTVDEGEVAKNRCDEPEVYGLLALCELTVARFPARTGPDGSPILLEDQDRRRWDLSAIRSPAGRAIAREGGQ